MHTVFEIRDLLFLVVDFLEEPFATGTLLLRGLNKTTMALLQSKFKTVVERRLHYWNAFLYTKAPLGLQTQRQPWYHKYPGYRRAFDPTRQANREDVTNRLSTFKRCCAFSRNGERCRRRFTTNTRMCYIHHKCITYSCRAAWSLGILDSVSVTCTVLDGRD